MAVVTSFAPDQDFWDNNPQLLLNQVFKDYYKSDKSRGKKDSSKVMWWIAFCYDLDRDNKWRGQSQEEKHLHLGLQLLDEGDFFKKNVKWLEPLINAYIKMTDTAGKRQLRSFIRKLEEKTETMDEMHYRDDPEAIEKMLLSNKNLYASLATIEKQLNEEDGEGTGRGGATPSGADKGEF
jgi:hypothetical protein